MMTKIDTIADRLARIQTRIARACEAVDRKPGSVRLLAASKQQPLPRILAALQCGHTLFGENRAQELRDKIDHIAQQGAALPQPEWHFIGHLQKNKVRLVVGRASLIHTLDSLRLAERIARRVAQQPPGPGGSPARMRVLIEVNIASEPTKAGVAVEHTLDLARAVHALPQLELQGLMTIPPWSANPRASRPHLDRLAGLAAEGRARGIPLHQLSMGMTTDLEEAIAAGATIVRVGTGIFGGRF